MQRVPLFSLVLLLVFAGAFWIWTGPGGRSSGRWGAQPCDSARAARVAIDSLTKVDPYRSRVLRFNRDSLGVRIVTMPDSGSAVTDGMAVIRVNDQCRIISLVQTDSA
jgi:hypothetical protein